MSQVIPVEDLHLITALVGSGMSVAEIAEKWEVGPRAIWEYVKRHLGKSPQKIKEEVRITTLVEALLNKESDEETAKKMGLTTQHFIYQRQKYRLADIENRDPNSLAMLMANREYKRINYDNIVRCICINQLNNGVIK